jgi:hypothetical protein
MGKYDKFSPQSHAAKRPWVIHPVWQGIGCILMFLIPVISYAAAVLIVQANVEQGWLPMPAELTRSVQILDYGSVDYLFANLLVAALLSILIFTVMFAFYSLLYRSVGPSQYGPMDAPPNEFRRKQKKRR